MSATHDNDEADARGTSYPVRSESTQCLRNSIGPDVTALSPPHTPETPSATGRPSDATNGAALSWATRWRFRPART